LETGKVRHYEEIRETVKELPPDLQRRGTGKKTVDFRLKRCSVGGEGKAVGRGVSLGGTRGETNMSRTIVNNTSLINRYISSRDEG